MVHIHPPYDDDVLLECMSKSYQDIVRIKGNPFIYTNKYHIQDGLTFRERRLRETLCQLFTQKK